MKAKSKSAARSGAGRAESRDTGIELLGRVQWGTHLCHFYETADDLLRVLVPYFKAGLKANELCVWITSHPVGLDEAQKALAAAVPGLHDLLRSGQMLMLPHENCYGGKGPFSADRVHKAMLGLEEKALADGRVGLRVSGNASWLRRADLAAFMDYERRVDAAIGGRRVLAVCSYPVEQFTLPELVEVLDTHEFGLVRGRVAWRKLAGGRLRALEELRHANAELAAEKRRLEDKNTAFREAMCALEAEKNRVRDEVAANVNEVVLPLLKRMRAGHADPRRSLELLERSLGGLLSSFGRRISDRSARLTPREMEISSMVRAGLTSKEIAGLTGASVQTVDKHRNNIRRKLGLANKGQNLVSYLNSL